MHLCYLCNQDRDSYSHYFCQHCRRIQTIIAAYSPQDCAKILETICLRSKKQIETKTDHHAPQQKERHKGIKGLDGDQ